VKNANPIDSIENFVKTVLKPSSVKGIFNDTGHLDNDFKINDDYFGAGSSNLDNNGKCFSDENGSHSFSIGSNRRERN
jgi:hypothetical protein